MPATATPLFATDCIGATISHVRVFPTHITYRQKLGRDISIAVDMIAAGEKQVHEHGFVILRTTSRRRIICMVSREQAEVLYTTIRNAYDCFMTTSRDSEQKTRSEPRRQPKLPSTRSEERGATTHQPPVFPPKELRA